MKGNIQQFRKFSEIRGVINNTFKPTVVQKVSRIKVYNNWLSQFCYVEVKFGPLEKKIKKLTSFDMKVFRRTAGCNLCDHKRNEEIWEELKVETFDEKLRRHKPNWLRHIPRMKNKRMPKIMLNYRPSRRRRLERTLKRLLDEAETGLSRPNS